jgi:hypothetical protein
MIKMIVGEQYDIRALSRVVDFPRINVNGGGGACYLNTCVTKPS